MQNRIYLQILDVLIRQRGALERLALIEIFLISQPKEKSIEKNKESHLK